jgi:thioredoxin reductase
MADALILGAGAAGLHAVFQLGLAGLSAEVIEQGPAPGGQLARYGDKPVHDMPGFLTVTGGEVLERLHAQALQMKPVFHFGEKVTGWEPGFTLTCASGRTFRAPILILAGGPKYATAVNPADCMSAQTPGLFAVGDAAAYPGKLNYLIPAFHEAALMAQKAFSLLKGKPA